MSVRWLAGRLVSHNFLSEHYEALLLYLDILQDVEHIAAEFRQMFTEKEIALMNLDEQV